MSAHADVVAHLGVQDAHSHGGVGGDNDDDDDDDDDDDEIEW